LSILLPLSTYGVSRAIVMVVRYMSRLHVCVFRLESPMVSSQNGAKWTSKADRLCTLLRTSCHCSTIGTRPVGTYSGIQ